MRNRKDDRRIRRFLGWSSLILFTPWLLIAALKAMQSYQGGLLDNGDLALVLIGVTGVAFGALVLRLMPAWRARRSSQ